MVKGKLMQKALSILYERGKESVSIAKSYMRLVEVRYKPFKNALEYFAEDWNDFLHPALLSLASEAVNKSSQSNRSTAKVGAAIVLLAGGADLHDDIIDNSLIKGSKNTVLGKFDKEIAILVGDTYLLKGVNLLHDACEDLSKNDQKEVLRVVERAFLESGGAEAKAAKLKGRLDLTLREFLNIVDQKAATAEATARIGAIFGNANKNEISTLGHYGRTYGKLLSLRDEFIDIFEIEELNQRMESEILPLPILLVISNKLKGSEMLSLLKKPITEDRLSRIVDLSMDSKEARKLVKYMTQLVTEEINKLKAVNCYNEKMEDLLWASLEDL